MRFVARLSLEPSSDRANFLRQKAVKCKSRTVASSIALTSFARGTPPRRACVFEADIQAVLGGLVVSRSGSLGDNHLHVRRLGRPLAECSFIFNTICLFCKRPIPLYCSSYKRAGRLKGGGGSASRGVSIGGVCLDSRRLSTGSVKKKVAPSPGCDAAQIRPPRA